MTFKARNIRTRAAHGVKQKITVVDKAHPITQGVADGFEIVDEDRHACRVAAVGHQLGVDGEPEKVRLKCRGLCSVRHRVQHEVDADGVRVW